MKMRIGFGLLGAALVSAAVRAEITLPAVFGDGMVLQQNADVAVWGWAKPLEEVTVVPEWDGRPVKAVADNQARWKVTLRTPPAGGPYTVTFLGGRTLVLRDVWAGEVWLCSGQSNMEWSAAAGIDGAAGEIPAAACPAIRFFQVAQRSAAHPQEDCAGRWTSCTPETMRRFSAVAYFFGRRLADSLRVPVGLIHASWGGTPAEAWMHADTVAADPVLSAAAARIPEMPWCPEKPGAAFNAMIAPLVPYRIAGAIWYQGETNTNNPLTYDRLFGALIRSWRNAWDSDFPFYYVQIAPYRYGIPGAGARVREAQRLCLSVPKTGMVVVSDIGNVADIHPRNKRDVGARLAAWALARTYGRGGIPFSGPLYRGFRVEGRRIRVFFDHAQNGLARRGRSLTHFRIAGPDRVFTDADAVLDGSTVLVSAPSVRAPAAVRFAFENEAEPNLFNAEGLPASCFRTDDWEAAAP